ncbi:glycosyltransferase [Syntrophomonas palmitatica]|uniref:glycosyltransferase n=1 Tax=Syntrophomonas palmitatica TaxID=402877 RepID=UPI00155DAD98|nr:glycosyltransferase family A protein [Syntrophomonas palmitatica]
MPFINALSSSNQPLPDINILNIEFISRGDGMPVIVNNRSSTSIDLRKNISIGGHEALSGHKSKRRTSINLKKGRTKVPKLPGDGVSVITCTHRQVYLDRLLENYLRQIYPLKELIIVVNNDNIDIADWQYKASPYADIRIFRLEGNTSLGECYNFAVEQSQYNYIAKFDDDDYYAPQCLADAMLAFLDCDADIIGKLCRYVYFESSSTLALCGSGLEHMPAQYVVGATMVFKKHIFKRVRFRNITAGEDSEFQNDCLANGYKIFSIDKYNYVTIRHPDTETHTFNFDDMSYLAQCEFVANTNNFKPYITRNRAFYI